jgi:Transcriptional activator of acetoin/glycerol metabolism
MENAVIFSEKSQITPDLLPSEILEYQPGVAELSVDGITLPEKEIIARALNAARGNVSNAARAVGISRNTMYRKIDKYGLRHSK